MIRSAHQLAAAQLADLEMVSHGAIEVLAQPDADDDRFLVSLDTSGIPRGAGIRVRAREQFRIRVSETFPYRPPTADVEHRRWKKTPHVHWGRLLCLYAAPSVEWNPADGMRGFIERLLTWLERAAEGTLDPEGQPLHPPVAYGTTEAGSAIIHPDLGDRVPWFSEGRDLGQETARLFAWCTREGDRVEVIEWLSVLETYDRVLSDDVETVDQQGRPYFFSPVLLITDEIGWEYPLKARHLAAGLAESGYTHEDLLTDLTWTSRLNRYLRSKTAEVDTDLDTDPIVTLLGTPSRRVNGGQRLAHLVAWKLDKLGGDITSLLGRVDAESNRSLGERVRELAHDWLGFADVQWMLIHEMRPEVTNRRDRGTAASWLYGKRVLVLGCGALGAPVAEYCVRAGAAALMVLDNGVVTPGILVRQPYSYADIGRAKADALAERLNTLTRQPVIGGVNRNAVSFLLDAEFDPTAFDLIIDAAADVSVRAVLERVRWQRRGLWPPLVTVIIGHEADRGLVAVSRAGATGGGHDVLRRVALRARQTRAWKHVADEFFPDPPRTEMFFPEPGCSAPTFVGSAAEVSALAAHMLVEALRSLVGEKHSRNGTMTAIAVMQTPIPDDRRSGVGDVLTWSNDLVYTDPDTGYEVRISAEALAEMRAETRRGARVRGPQVETGGMMLGAFDDSTGVISIDVATGPPPDSRLSNTYFDHGTAGTQDLIDHHVRRSGGITGFVGIWHTHPNGRAFPSPIDEAGMSVLTTFAGTGRRALMVILGGAPPVWRAWSEATGLPDVYVRVVRRDHTINPPHALRRVQPEPPPGQYFPGGYSYSTDSPAANVTSTGRRRPWWFFRVGR